MQKFYGFILIAMMVFSGCISQVVEPENSAKMDSSESVSYPVRTILLDSPLDEASAEISGMAWYEDWLVLLPQYPDQYAEAGNNGTLFYIERENLLAYLNQNSEQPIQVAPFPLIAEGIRQTFKGYEGFEAIAFIEDSVYLTVECNQAGRMQGYLVKGQISEQTSPALVIDLENIVELEPQTKISNMTDEALLVYDNEIYTFYEANGESVNEDPVSHHFDRELNFLSDKNLPNVPFRLTDVTQVDEMGKFWGMNYYYPGDTSLAGDFKTDPYKISDEKVLDPELVERIISFEFSPTGEIQINPQDTIVLEYLPDDVARNWEGLVLLENYGFLMVTDKFPTTILGFVEYP